MAQADTKLDATRAEEDWTPRKLTLMGVVTLTIVFIFLYNISS
jgi:hypothetical protein